MKSKKFFKFKKILFCKFEFFLVQILFFCFTGCTTNKLSGTNETLAQNQKTKNFAENAIPYGKIEELSDFDFNIPEFFAEKNSFARHASLSNDWNSKNEFCVKFTFASKNFSNNFSTENSSVFYCDDFLTEDWKNTNSILADFYNSTKDKIEICLAVKIENFDSLIFTNQEILEPGENKNIDFNFGNFFCNSDEQKNEFKNKKTLYVIFKSPLKNGNLYLDNLRLVKN